MVTSDVIDCDKMSTNENAETASEKSTIARVSLKIPPFWRPDPRIWFLQIETHHQTIILS